MRETTMPGVLVELGYISTPDEERYLLTENGTSALAKSIYQAFANYRKQHTGIDSPIPAVTKDIEPIIEENAIQASPSPKTKVQNSQATQKQTTKTSDKPIFKIQFLSSSKKLPAGSKQFKGLKPINHYRENGLYKYTYGESTDYNQIASLKRKITPKFKDAFIIAFKNGKKVNVNEAINEFKKNNKR